MLASTGMTWVSNATPKAHHGLSNAGFVHSFSSALWVAKPTLAAWATRLINDANSVVSLVSLGSVHLQATFQVLTRDPPKLMQAVKKEYQFVQKKCRDETKTLLAGDITNDFNSVDDAFKYMGMIKMR